MQIIIGILFIVFTAWWRRWFGGAFIGGKKLENKWFNRRITQHIVNCAVMFALFFFCIEWYYAVFCVAVIEGLFWSPGHGPAFDMSRAGIPEDPSRYKKVWWNKVCEFLVPEKYWYQYGYDWLWMAIRYTYPCAFLIPFFGPSILFMGLIVTPVYGICSSFYERINMSRFPSWLDRANKLSEIIVGATTGAFLWGLL